MVNSANKSSKNYKKSYIILKIFESIIIWRQSGIAIFFCLEMVLIWVKMLPISISQSLWKTSI